MIFRFLLLLFVFWVVSKLLRSLAFKPKRPAQGTTWPGGSTVAGGELVQDPHCGVYVPKDTALRGRNGARFCSEACRVAHERDSA